MIEPKKVKGITYAAEITDCPECKGYGYFETMTWLTYDGDQTWRTDPCENCEGGKSLEPVRCVLCGDEIEMKDYTEWMGKHAHKECVESEKEAAEIVAFVKSKWEKHPKGDK